MSWAIVRPSVLFGGAGVLLNNVAWLLRHLDAFVVPGDGHYPVRPTHVEDVADLMVELGGTDDHLVLNAGHPPSRPSLSGVSCAEEDAPRTDRPLGRPRGIPGGAGPAVRPGVRQPGGPEPARRAHQRTDSPTEPWAPRKLLVKPIIPLETRALLWVPE